jgi:hypothetical protein
MGILLSASFLTVQLVKQATEIYLIYLSSQSSSQRIEPGPRPATLRVRKSLAVVNKAQWLEGVGTYNIFTMSVLT